MPAYSVKMQFDRAVPMRDAVTLSSDLYLPDAPGKWPCVLMRTPYSNATPENIEKARRLANHGYAVLIQDVRGRWDSEGSYYPFLQDADDGFDTQEWIGQQPWSNGRIGMVGGSYLGWVQWQSALRRSRHLTCLAPRVMCGDLYSGLVYPGGAFQLNVMMTWGMRTSAHTAQDIHYHNWTEVFETLPLRDAIEKAGGSMPFWRDWLDHPTYDDYWEQADTETRWGEITVPALIMGGWYDLYSKEAFTNFNGMRQHSGSDAAKRSRLIMGPWPHRLSQSSKCGDVDFGAQSQLDLEAVELRWLNHWLKDLETGTTNEADEAPLRLFIMGSNEWRDETEWPLARTDWQDWHLHGLGSANTARGNGYLSREEPGEETPDRYEYDPLFPVQTLGGGNCCSPEIVPWGPYDQRPAEMRPDVLCYTSKPLEADLEVTGPITLVLHAATDGLDTDWTAKLCDVHPNGYARLLCDGIQRARYRESRTEETLLQPGKIYVYEIEVGVTANVFRKGHCIRLDVSSSNFPRFDRNLNTGQPCADDASPRTAKQTVYHAGAYPSRLKLPVIPR